MWIEDNCGRVAVLRYHSDIGASNQNKTPNARKCNESKTQEDTACDPFRSHWKHGIKRAGGITQMV